MATSITRRTLLQVSLAALVAPSSAFRRAKGRSFTLAATMNMTPEEFDGPYFDSFGFIRTDAYELIVQFEVDSTYLFEPLFVRAQAADSDGEYLSVMRIDSQIGVARFKVGTWGHDGERMLRITIADSFGNVHPLSPIVFYELPAFSSDGVDEA